MKKIGIILIFSLFFNMSKGQLFNHSEMGQRAKHTQNEQAFEYFLHGVASGDPTQNSVIIWTRVSNEISEEELEVSYTVATKPDMLTIITEGKVTTSAEKDYTVKIDVENLEPGTTYYYEFNYMEETSVTGRTRTAAFDDEHLRFGVVSCSDYQAGYFNTYGLLATHSDLDAVIHLGDYIYEYGKRTNSWDSLLMRGFEPNHEIYTLIDYRTRYSFYRLDDDLQAVHQQHPFIMVWDDHETANDSHVEGAQNHDETEGNWEERKAVAKKAWFEWMPVRENENQKIYRSVDYGKLVNLSMLDTRLEGRMPQIEIANDSALFEPDRTILGKEQLGWFKNELLNNEATWHIIGNQVIFGHVDVGPLSIVPQAATFFYDTWVGYPTERDTIINFLNDNNLDNVIITTGDFHITLAVDIAVNPFDSLIYKPETGEGSVCVEMAVPSVSSANFDENASVVVPGLSEEGFVEAVNSSIPTANPHLKKLELVSHGYALLDITTEKAQVDYFYTDTLYIPSSNEIYGGSLMTNNGDNHWQEVGEPSESKAESPELVRDLTPVDEFNINNALHILGSYPNPADDFSLLNIQINEVTVVDMQLLDMNGKLIRQLANEKVMPGFYSLNINTKSLNNGIYIISVNAEKSIRNLKLVVQH